MREATLCFLTQGEPPTCVLLGYKKVGFGAGKHTGFGGKIEAGEAVAEAAARELGEETGIWVLPEKLRCVGDLTFVFPSSPGWSQRVHVFLACTWEGEPTESREMVPVWFPVDTLPLDRMWHDARFWLPPILDGQKLRARFTFEADNETVSAMATEPWDEAGSGGID